jgi:hypothetical protein
LQLFASKRTIEAADKVVSRILETHYQPKIDLRAKLEADPSFDILREFTERCREELRRSSN